MLYETPSDYARSEYLGAAAGHTHLPGLDLSRSVVARVNIGRWLADCACGAARLVDPSRPFWCPGCGNAATGGHAVPIVWPEDRATIDAVLAAREAAGTCNWEPHETVADLMAENEAHGLPPIDSSALLRADLTAAGAL